MAILNRLIADIWADPHCHVEGRCTDHPKGSLDCLLCQLHVVARWDVELSRRLWCLFRDYTFANLILLRRRMKAAGIEHHWEEVIGDVKRSIADRTPFDPNFPELEV